MSEVQQLFAEAVELQRRGALAEAEERYQRVQVLLPDHPSVLANLALVYRDMGKLAEAERFGSQAVAADPENPGSHLNLGAVLESRGDLNAARNSYQTAHRLSPDNPQILNNLGKLLHQMGETIIGRSFLERALQLAPDYPAALNNLGVICSDQGDLAQAERLLERSLALDSQNINTRYNLAGICNARKYHDRALQHLEDILRLAPNHEAAAHMRAALSGTTPTIAPRRYVEEVFDKYAPRFDHHLQMTLGYTAPQALAELVREHCETRLPFAHLLDLGCGTGLSGAAFRQLTRHLTGIDLSSPMLAQARQKNLYDHLVKDELLDFLERDNTQYDAFVAADVLVYLGNPEPLFALVGQRSAPRAILACSIERASAIADYILLPSGRYAHNPASLQRCAAEHGLTVLGHRDHQLRKEEGVWLAGDLFLFLRNEQAGEEPKSQEKPHTP